MTQELSNILINRYAKVLVQEADNSIPTMISCGDGWFAIIDALLSAVSSRAKEKKLENLKISVIREKFGSLNVYINSTDEFIRGCVSTAIRMSKLTCEKCGTTENVGHTKEWKKTLCETCYKKEARYANLTWAPINNTREFKIAKLISATTD